MTFLMVVSYTVLPHALLAKFERGAFFICLHQILNLIQLYRLL
ncbi:Uncharacterised protein [Streptococcus pyogenes]|nr:Uncharacterised protein [Streptococcus pyogenes]VGQ85369.1 Uncharacterised protein [Streptococcus pyogenes]VGU05088.1 Uncharacterised protein [Streptococcus pyogenes]VGU88876.1 Uncharacterised protein [Streptococcus pyogenes]VGV01608.1 Uncharacterised protein [Streptococcus pyogenes]